MVTITTFTAAGVTTTGVTATGFTTTGITATVVIAAVPPTAMAAVPIDIGRDEARDLADRELSSPRYAEETSSWLRQALEWIWARVLDLIDLAGGGTAGRIVIAVAAAALIGGVVLVIRRARPDVGRSVDGAPAVFGDRRLTAAEYRAAADAAAADGDWSAAVVDRFRALAAELEDRGVIEPRVGRTADELAREAGTAMPPIRADIDAATTLFDEVRYGGHAADADDHRQVQRLDDTIRRGARRDGGRDARRAMTTVMTSEPPR